MGTSNGGMDNGQVSQKGMMIKIECELQVIKIMDENDELGQWITYYMELLEYNLVKNNVEGIYKCIYL